MQREVVADMFDAMYLFETECCDKCQFHIEDAVFVIGSEHEIAISETNGVFHIGDWRLKIGEFQLGFGIGDVRVIESGFGHFDPGAQIKIGTSGITDILHFRVTIQML